ncbi:MAG TPA: hypothetical protein VL485_06435 [Ktedonobacteraceae bacterium]|jgi:hypothetical protein|nr:hypothetical protein [Ktedonobacteraceae bacterium]
MSEEYVERTHTEHVVLDIGQEVGALIVYTRPELCNQEIEVNVRGSDARKTHTNVHERLINGRTVFAAVFQELRAGEYTLWHNGQADSTLTISGGEVCEIDWRGKTDVCMPAFHRHDRYTTRQKPAPPISAGILPPRYQGNRIVSAAPMGAAPLRYSESGQVAWNEMWSSFCDLALAGGPPHRDTLLEPATPEEVQADLDAYERNISEIERGLRLVTGLSTQRSEKLGWVGLVCADEEMALWLLRAIVVENICVRREGRVLFLPVGPLFRLEKEIKNVITAVAKTHHYWTEHSLARL